MRTPIGRRSFVAASAAALTGGLSASAARAGATTPDVSWRLTSSFPRTLDLMYGGAETFARTVSDLTGGRFHIDVFPAGEVTPGLQALDAVQAGSVDACQTAMDYFYGKDPTFALATAIPFGLNARGQSAFSNGGNGDGMFNDFLAGFNVVAFPAGNTGAQMGGFFRKPLTSIADLAGLKIRIGGFGALVLQKLGAVPQATPKADMIAALDRGDLDAVTWVSPYDDEKLAGDRSPLLKAAPNYHYPGWWRGGSVIHVAFNKIRYDALPKPFQAALRAAAQVANAEMLGRYDASNPAALTRLVAAGAQLQAFPRDVLEAAFRTTRDALREIADGNPGFKAMLEAMGAFRADEYLWWQVAEYTFDNFMIRQRAKG